MCQPVHLSKRQTIRRMFKSRGIDEQSQRNDLEKYKSIVDQASATPNLYVRQH